MQDLLFCFVLLSCEWDWCPISSGSIDGWTVDTSEADIFSEQYSIRLRLKKYTNLISSSVSIGIGAISDQRADLGNFM